MSLPAMGNVTSGGDIDVISGETVGGGGVGAAYVEAACTERLAEVEWARAAILASFLVLGVINVMVIAGNTLVIAAVFLSSKLRTVTNLFIVSLAVSDLLVGICVLPFSTSYEVLGVWIFGDVWCQMWLAVDVWMCTASILNLCAISLDRYVAVTRPVSYPSIMSSRRAKILIAIVWSLSFVICLPPLVGWNDTSGTASGMASGVNLPPSSTTALPLANGSGNNSATTFLGLEEEGEEGRPARSLLSYRSDNDIFESIDVDYGQYDDRTGSGLNLTDVVNGLGVVRRVMAAVLSVRAEDSAAGSQGADVSDWTSALLANLSEASVVAASNDSAPSPVVVTGATSGGGGGDTSGSGSGVSYGRANMNATSQAACTCLLISDKGYRIYSALGSFYLPMLVMMFFYWKIYRAAVETTRAINQGFRTTKSVGGGAGAIGGRFDEQRLTLRIHRGRSSTDLYGNGSCGGGGAGGADFRTSRHHHRRRGAVRNSSLKDKWSAAAGRAGHRCISGMTFPPSSDGSGGGQPPRKQRSLQNANHASGGGASPGVAAPPQHSRRRAASRQNHWTTVQCRTSEGTTLPVTSTYAAVTAAVTAATSATSTAAAAAVVTLPSAVGPPAPPNSASSLDHSPREGASAQRFEFIPLNEQTSTRRDEAGQEGGDVVASTSRDKPPAPPPSPRDQQQQLKQNGGGNSGNGGGGCGASGSERGPQIFAKMGKRNIKAQVKRFRTETKAAKTLGIIVGGFILCWLPFFTTYLVGAFCAEDCVPESLFAVFFWLGYCNSAINPCVYAFFSRDFRHAFKRILCRCFMRREHSVKERLATMLPTSLQLASFFEESEDGSNSH